MGEVIKNMKNALRLSGSSLETTANQSNVQNENTQLDYVKEAWMKKLRKLSSSNCTPGREKQTNRKSSNTVITSKNSMQTCDSNISQLDGVYDDVDLDEATTSSTSEHSEADNDLIEIPSSEISENEKNSDPSDGSSQRKKEEILNSEDDLPDADKDLSEILTYNENLIVCKAEKVINNTEESGLKFKFYLKDGIMRITGKEYTFSKANGEAQF